MPVCQLTSHSGFIGSNKLVFTANLSMTEQNKTDSHSQ